MLSIYICDDIQDHILQFKNVIEHFLMFKDWDIQIIKVTTNPKDLLAILEKQTDMGLYFLDVDLKSDINGFQLAEIIREHDPRGFIVFISTHGECSHIPYEQGIEALNYILKDDPKKVKNQIEQCLQKAYTRYIDFTSDERYHLVLKASSTTYFIKFDDIILIRTSIIPHQIEIIKKDGIFSNYGKLKDILNNLDNRFFRIHNSYIININCIKNINMKAKEIKMCDGTILPASVPNLRKFMSILNNNI